MSEDHKFSYCLVPEHNYVHFTFRGEWNVEELIAQISQIIKTPDCQPGMSVLLEIIEANVQLDFDGILRLRMFLLSVKRVSGNFRVAVAVPIHFPVSLIHTLHIILADHGVELRDFDILAGAQLWLGGSGHADKHLNSA